MPFYSKAVCFCPLSPSKGWPTICFGALICFDSIQIYNFNNQKSFCKTKTDNKSKNSQKWHGKNGEIFAKQMSMKFTLKSEELSP